MDTVIKLVSTTFSEDSRKQTIAIETDREVFAKRKSISSKEFFQASERGLKPQLVVEVRAFEYNGEEVAIVDGKRYTIYRSYTNANEFIELYLESRSGS